MSGSAECRVRYVPGFGYQVLTQRRGWVCDPENGEPTNSDDMAALLVWRAYNAVSRTNSELVTRPDGLLIRVRVEAVDEAG